MEGLYQCTKEEGGNANRINGHSKATFKKVEAGHPIIRIREIELEQGINVGS